MPARETRSTLKGNVHSRPDEKGAEERPPPPRCRPPPGLGCVSRHSGLGLPLDSDADSPSVWEMESNDSWHLN
ncbi:hypothetical protein R6Z07F_014732 [Ovis aries]